MKNRITATEQQPKLLGVPDQELLAIVQTITERYRDEPGAKPSGDGTAINRITRPISEERFRRDRFSNVYGVSTEEAAEREFPELAKLLARGMMEHDLCELDQFTLELRHLEHHTEQLLRLHQSTKAAFERLHRCCQEWLYTIADAGLRGRYAFSPELRPEEIQAGRNAVHAALAQWNNQVRQHLSLGEAADCLPRAEPFSIKNFAHISPEEQLEQLRAFWHEALIKLAVRFLQVIAAGVDQGPFVARDDVLFALIRVDEPNRKAVYSYWRRDIQRTDTSKETDRKLRTRGSHLFKRPKKIQTTITNTSRQVSQLVNHTHAITKVERYEYSAALNTAALAMPAEIAEAMRAAPEWARPHLDVYYGNLALELTVAQDRETKESVTERTRHVCLPPEPALTFARAFVLCGWSPADMQLELKRRAQVRIRQLRQAQIAEEKNQAQARHAKELDEIRDDSALPIKSLATTVAILLLSTAAYFAFYQPNSVGLLVALGGLVLLGLFVPLPYLLYVTLSRKASRKQLRGELAKLETEETRLQEEITTLRNTPTTEL